jgi:hypothetical protein
MTFIRFALSIEQDENTRSIAGRKIVRIRFILAVDLNERSAFISVSKVMFFSQLNLYPSGLTSPFNNKPVELTNPTGYS